MNEQTDFETVDSSAVSTDPDTEGSRAIPGNDREWISLEHDGDTYLFDVTFLSSNWSCIYGAGCQGIREYPSPELNEGCCTFGAHFSDAADRRNVAAQAKRLREDQWQFKSLAETIGGPIIQEGPRSWKTAVHDDACIFLNRNDFERGAGCALHVGALDAGESFLEWKPEVCWQVPLRLNHHVDDVGHTTWTLSDWKRRDWGEGGAEFHWWCTDTADAYVGTESVVISLSEEITALVGHEVYNQLLVALAERSRKPAGTLVTLSSTRRSQQS